MKIILITLLTFFLTSNLIYSQTFEWAQSIRSDGSFANSHDTETDKDGNVYVTGRFGYTPITFGQPNSSNTITLLPNANTGETTFLAKYNSSGEVIWARNIGGVSAGCWGSHITCDNEGNSFVTGFFTNTINFENNISLTSLNGTWDPYIAKYDNLGVCQWARSASGPGADHGISIDVDNSGNCYVAGTFYNTLSFISNISSTAGTVTSNGGSDAFLAKYTSDGIFQWAVSGGSLGEDYRLIWSPYVLTVSVDTDGDAYLAGGVDSNNAYFSGRTDPLPRGAYYVKYSSNGVYLEGITDAYEPYFVGIGIDSAKNVYTIGETTNTKYDINGNRAWRKSLFATAGIFSIAAETDIDGNSYISGEYRGTAYFPPYSIVSSGGTDLFVAKIEPTHGDVLWVRSAGGQSIGREHAHGIAADRSGNVYMTSHFYGPINFGSIVLTTEQPEDLFIAKISPTSNEIKGKVFIDNPNAGSSGEQGFSNVIVEVTNGNEVSYVATNNSGEYTAFCGTGQNTVRVIPPLYYTLTTASSYTINFPGSGFGNRSTGNNFGMQLLSDVNDLSININAHGPARPGMPVRYCINYKYDGSETIFSPEISFHYDASRLTYVGSGILPTTHSGGDMDWLLSDITSRTDSTFCIDFILHDTVDTGTVLRFDSQIGTLINDINTGNNNVWDSIRVTSSYDPNDISVKPAGDINPQNIQEEDSLTYTIRFQNTGNDTAFTVIVTDSISDKLNLASIETISSSHDYRFRIIDGYKLAWTFDNILLPDSTTNEIESHGFIKYRIKPKNNLVIGDEITNSASIYFDFNEPVLTNTVVTRVIQPPVDLKFAPKIDFTSGINPISVSIGDLNGDGKSDLAVANLNNNSVSVLRNISVSGTISLDAKVDFPTGLNPRCVKIRDIDGDGKLDLVVTNYNSNKISVFRNTSSLEAINFASKIDFTTGVNPRNVSIEDLNGDGKPDLAITNDGSNSVSVLRNTSDSGMIEFDAKIDFGTGTLPISLSIGYIDGDNKPDLAVANYNSNTVSVLLNTSASGALSFADKTDFITGTNPYDVKIGDLDSDGKSDLAVSNNISNSISILQNISSSGSISFSDKTDFLTGANPNNLSIGDLDGDGKLEITVSNTNSNTVSVFHNKSASGNMSFSTKEDYGTGTNPYSVSIGDIDGDGQPDMVTANRNSNNVSVLRNLTNSPQRIVKLTMIHEGLYNNEQLNMKDTVRAYLRNTTAPYTIVDSAKAVIDSLTFNGNFNFTNFTAGTYYIQVNHRNSIETWSKNGAPLTAGTQNTYDFTASQSQAFGNNLKLVGSKYCIYSGDVNQDGIVDLSDLNAIYNTGINFTTGYLNTDLNGDGIVDLSDISIAYNNGINFVGVVKP